MSPLVTRRLEIENDQTTFSKDTVEHTTYIPREEVRPGDKIVDPRTVSPRQLAELALMYPEEFAAAAEERGIKPGAEGSDARLSEFLRLNAKELVKRVTDELDGERDEKLLYALLEAEFAREDQGDEPRVGVLKAIAAKGISLE
jgi:hypothetical protein